MTQICIKHSKVQRQGCPRFAKRTSSCELLDKMVQGWYLWKYLPFLDMFWRTAFCPPASARRQYCTVLRAHPLGGTARILGLSHLVSQVHTTRTGWVCTFLYTRLAIRFLSGLSLPSAHQAQPCSAAGPSLCQPLNIPGILSGDGIPHPHPQLHLLGVDFIPAFLHGLA